MMESMESCVPPGFRFHPTDEELVGYYLRKKIASQKIDLDVIREIDLYRIEPWDLQERCRIGYEEQNEWYFFSHKDKKYPTGTRTNRATMAGFWKATGRDKAVYDKMKLIGMRKTLVFYKGRAPNGQKSDWIMHEYRLESDQNAPPQEEGWVVCRAFKKKTTNSQSTTKSSIEGWDRSYFYDLEGTSNINSMLDPIISRQQQQQPSNQNYLCESYNMCKQEIEVACMHADQQFVQLPHLESPSLPPPLLVKNSNIDEDHQKRLILLSNKNNDNNSARLAASNDNNNNSKVIADWRDLDKFVASQLSHDHHEVESDEGVLLSSFGNENIESSDMALLLMQQGSRDDEGDKFFNGNLDCSDIGICVFEK